MFEFASHWVWLLLPLPWLVYFMLPSAKRVAQTALQIPFYHELTEVNIREQRALPRLSGNYLLGLMIWLCLLTALAGPRWLGHPLALPQAGRNIMLALDISASMEMPDMQLYGRPATRLAVVKAVARGFIHQRVGDRLGLILFGTKAYLQTPLTFDRQTVEHMLNDATIGLAGKHTAMGDAIGLAIKHLQQTPGQDRILVLLTDGASNAGELLPAQASQLASDYKVKIYTIGIGAHRMLVPGLLGPQVINPAADLDESTLKSLARETDGLFFRAADAAELAKVYRTIDKLEPVVNDQQVYRPIQEYYYWPLLLALGLGVVWLVRRLL